MDCVVERTISDQADNGAVRQSSFPVISGVKGSGKPSNTRKREINPDSKAVQDISSGYLEQSTSLDFLKQSSHKVY